MSAPVDRPHHATQEHPAPEVPDSPAALTPPTPGSEKRGIEERGWLLFAVVIAFILLAFAGMVLLTALGGGTDYVR